MFAARVAAALRPRGRWVPRSLGMCVLAKMYYGLWGECRRFRAVWLTRCVGCAGPRPDRGFFTCLSHFSVRLCAHCIFPSSHSSITPLVSCCALYIMLMQFDLKRCREHSEHRCSQADVPCDVILCSCARFTGLTCPVAKVQAYKYPLPKKVFWSESFPVVCACSRHELDLGAPE